MPASNIPDTQETNSTLTNTGLSTTTAENNVEKVEITTFHDVEIPNRYSTPMVQNTAATGNMDDTHSIIQFLERPVRIAQFEKSTKSGDEIIALKPFVFDIDKANRQQPFWQAEMPSTLINAGHKIDKLQNFKYFKADINIKLVLNANPFVAGRFYLTYSPYEQRISYQRKQQYSSRAGVTAYPGVEIDIQLDNSVELVIPYASYREAYDLTASTDDYLTVFLYGITELIGPATGTTTFVDISIFAWFTNIELVIPTFNPVAGTQFTGEVVKYIKSEISENDKQRLLMARKIEQLKKKDKTMYDYFMRYLTGVKEVEMQVAAEAGPGPISEISGTVKDIAGKVGSAIGGLPIIGEVGKGVADTVGWVADIVNKIASIFGWSKPSYQESVCPLINVPGMGYTHYKGIDMGVPLALSTQNELGMPGDVFPSGIDEMDLAYVCANPGVKSVVKWSTSSPIGQPLMNAQDPQAAAGSSYGQGTQVVTIAPTTEYAHEVSVGTVKTTYWLTDTVPCEYVSSLFTYWRATICFKICVVKTAFHTGRLEILFNPGIYPRKSNDSKEVDDAAVANIDTTNNYKYILDITNDTEITVRIPYVSSKQFLSTEGLFNESDWNEYAFENTLTGALFIRPISKLLAPPTVSDYVQVVVWKWAEDVELVCPKPSRNDAPVIFDPSDVGKNTRRRREVEMQINISNKANGNVITFFDSSSASSQNQIALLRAGGERIVNLRILLRCFRALRKLFGVGPGNNLVINVQEDDVQGYDYLSYLSYMYRFFRGGVRFKFFTTSYANDGGLPVMSTSLIQSSLNSTNVDQGPTHITYANLNPVHEVTVPFYSQYRKLPISLPADREFMGVVYQSSVQSTGQLYRAGSDDFTFGWLVGTPQILARREEVGIELYYPTDNDQVYYSIAKSGASCDKGTGDPYAVYCFIPYNAHQGLKNSPFFNREIPTDLANGRRGGIVLNMPKSDDNVEVTQYITALREDVFYDHCLRSDGAKTFLVSVNTQSKACNKK